MTRNRVFHTAALAALAAVSSAACVQRGTGSLFSNTGDVAAEMRSPADAVLGVLRFEPASNGEMRIRGTLTGLPAGAHGIHVHETGRCDAPDFASAGAHLNPTGMQHGLENPAGPHVGDLPQIVADAAGNADVDISTMRLAIDASTATATALFDADGSALVIHAAGDDQRTDPSGNTGARIACGRVAKSR